MDPHALQFQFPCEARRSCVLRTEESLIGPTTMIETDLGGSVWLHFSQSGSSTNKVLANRVLRRGPTNRQSKLKYEKFTAQYITVTDGGASKEKHMGKLEGKIALVTGGNPLCRSGWSSERSGRRSRRVSGR